MSKHKAKTMHVGQTAKGARFGVPADIVTETTAIFGRRGSGKTHTAVTIVEQLLERGHQVVILDPLDVWWGLKSSKDGKSPGFNVLLIGDPRRPHTDLPLEKGDAIEIADFLVDERLSCILSMRHMSKSARKSFAAAFASRTYERKGDPGRNAACLFVIDEAGTFIPQRVMGEDAVMVGAFTEWVRQGRTSGIGVMMIDQRPATVNTEVRSQVELLITHQLSGPHDRKALDDWIVQHEVTAEQEKAFSNSLSTLRRGEAWFWSDVWLRCFERIQVADRTTFDSSATPKAGQSAAAPKARAEIDLDALKGKLAQSIEKKKATDPKLLQKRIAELQEFKRYTHARLDALGVPEFAGKDCRIGARLKWLHEQRQPAEVQVQRVEVPAVDERAMKRIEAGGQALVHAIERMERVIDSTLVKQGLHRIQLVFDELKNLKERCNVGDQRDSGTVVGAHRHGRVAAGASAPEAGRQPRGRTDTAAPQRRFDHGHRPANTGEVALHRPANEAGVEAGGFDGPSRRILNALGWWKAVGINAPTMAQLGFVAGYKPKGGSFNTYVSRLSTTGLVQRGGGCVSLTEGGRSCAETPPAPTTVDDLHGRIFDMLDGPQRKIISAVIDRGRDAELTRDEIAAVAGYEANGGSFNTYLSRLSTLGLIVRDRGRIRPTAVLWPEGLA